MPTTFLTGGTGFLGSYAARTLLDETDHDIILMVRAPTRRAGLERLWQTWQLHYTPEAFAERLPRLRLVSGDLHAPNLGLDPATREQLHSDVTHITHIAASLNRKSAKACLNTNLRGTQSVIKLARSLKDRGKLRRYAHVSTVAVAGHRHAECVEEDDAIDWARSDYDPYGRTKKFCEHMASEWLPDVTRTILRPSIVMGDPRFPQTTQFDMVRAFCTLADLPVIPLDPTWRLDIVDANWVGRAIAHISASEHPSHERYHLSAGTHSSTIGEIAAALNASTGRTPRFVPHLAESFHLGIRAANRAPHGTSVAAIGALLKVFWPYITYDTVFANDRAVSAMNGERPAPFPSYCGPLYTWSRAQNFHYPATPLPAEIA